MVMRLPGETGVEFLLLQPMVPINRPNMIAWIAARMDEPNYGATVVYRFPADTTVFGPGPDRGPDRPGPDRSASRSRCGTSPAARSSGAT